jgi:hypothetical protein
MVIGDRPLGSSVYVNIIRLLLSNEVSSHVVNWFLVMSSSMESILGDLLLTHVLVMRRLSRLVQLTQNTHGAHLRSMGLLLLL